jgi:single-strand DNA-binding protein
LDKVHEAKRKGDLQDMSFNKITIVGNLGRDPELRYTPQGVAVCTFTIATNEKRTNKAGEKEEVVTWFRVTAWRVMAENIAKYLTKGSLLYIEGRLRVDEWQDNEGKNRYTLDVQAVDSQFLGGGQGHGNEGTQAAPSAQKPASEFPTHTGGAQKPENDDDIPF